MIVTLNRSHSSALKLFRESIPNRRHRWLLVAGFWTLLGVVSSVVWMVLSVENQPYTWSQLLKAKFLVWWLWGLLTPAILMISARLSLLGPHKVSRGLWLFVFSLVITLGYMFGYAGLIFMSQPTNIVGPDYFKLAIWALWTHWGYFYVGYWLTVAVEHVAEQMRLTHDAALTKERLEGELVRARLDQVRQQMHPHFLFNTLNTISSQILTGDRSQAYDLVTGLAHYLRRGLLAGETQFCSLATEIELTEEYLTLILARYPDRLEVSTSLQPDTLNLSVPSLLLQPLIENAITHGVARYDTKTNLVISSSRLDDCLTILITNQTPGHTYGSSNRAAGSEMSDSDVHRTGLGLQTTAARLLLLYNKSASIVVRDQRTTEFCIEVTLPVSEFPEQATDPITNPLPHSEHATASTPHR